MLNTIVSSESSLFTTFHFLLIYKYFSSLFEIPFFTSSRCPFYRCCSPFDIFTTSAPLLFIVKISPLFLLNSFVNLSAVIQIS